MPENSIQNLLHQMWLYFGPVGMGAVAGAFWKVLRRPNRPWRAVMTEFIGAAVIGMVLGGFVGDVLSKTFGADPVSSAAAAGAVCAVLAEKIMKTIADKMVGKPDANTSADD